MPLSRRTFLALGAFAASGIRPSHAFALPTRPLDAPKPSDVCFSARWARPEALDVAKAFGASRLDWCYSADRAFLGRARQVGLSVLGGAVNSSLPDTPGGKTWSLGRILDAGGERVTAPWMKGWESYLGCVNSPDYRAIYLDAITAGLNAGIDYFLVDDAGMNATAVAWGGCFCPHCRQAAQTMGLDLGKDMAAVQRASVRAFHKTMRDQADAAAGRHVAFAYNCAGGWSSALRDFFTASFDFRICEIDPQGLDPDDVAARLVAAELGGKPQAFTLRSDDVTLNCAMAAWCYANGGHMLAPWDVYLRSTETGADRFFGDPADFAAIFPFARSLGPLLDHAAPSALPEAGSWSVSQPDAKVSLRADPAGAFAVLHVVPWGGPQPLDIMIDPARAAGSGTVAEARLHCGGHPPVPFERSGKVLRATAPPAPWAVVEMRLTG